MKQGPQWEVDLRKAAESADIPAWRDESKAQSKNAADVLWGYDKPEEAIAYGDPHFAVAWKRLVPRAPGAKRRSPDGERDVVVLALDDFLRIFTWAKLWNPDLALWIQAKAREQLNVTRTLAGLREWGDGL